eukprot:m.368133 g.368133  ORF g.368133 m.368133 type:complete len:54 (+) comp43993_c0_seq1:90-251(+)
MCVSTGCTVQFVVVLVSHKLCVAQGSICDLRFMPADCLYESVLHVYLDDEFDA